MYVNSMATMEDIVASNKALMWESFNVLEVKNASHNAPLKKQARYIDGAWHVVKVYPLTSQGWYVPKSWVN